MPLTAAQLDARLGRDELPPIILLAGAEPLLMLEAGDAVRASARAAGFQERSVHEATAGFDWNELVAGVSSLSLFSSRRLIELRLPTGRAGREGGAWLADFAKDPAPDVLLLVQAGQWSRAHEKPAWVKAVDRAGWFVPLWPIRRHELPGWIAQRLTARGLRADRDAVRLLAERVEGNLLAAAQEIDKLALLHPGGQLDLASMERLVADSSRHDVFGLVDAALQGDLRQALRIAASLRAEGQQVPALLGWLASQIELLVGFARLRESHGNPAQAMQKAGLWQSRQQAFQRAMSRGSSADFETVLVACARLERISKGRGDGDPWRLLERILVALVQPGRFALE